MSGILPVVIYALLTALWSGIFVLYLRHRREARRRDPLVAMLLTVLALDAFKSVVESSYFGLVWGAQYGVLGHALDFLARPAPLAAVKLLNLVVAAFVLSRLIRIWIPRQLAERSRLQEEQAALMNAARESEERFRTAFHTTPDAMSIFRIDDGCNVAVNQGYADLSGWKQEEILGATSSRLSLWADPKAREEFHAELKRTGRVKPREAVFVRREGKKIVTSISAKTFSVGGQSYSLNVVRDLTEARRAEKVRDAIYRIAEAAGTAETLREMLATVHQIVAELMPAPNFYIALNKPPSQTIEFAYLVDEVDREARPQNVGRGLTAFVLRTGQPMLVSDERDFEALVRAGEVESVGPPSVSWVGVPLKTRARETIGVLVAQSYTPGVLHDERDKEVLQFVSTQVAQAIERKQAEEALRASERRFRALIENASEGVAVFGADGLVIFLSPSASRLMGYEPLPGKKVSFPDFIHAEELQPFLRHWEVVLATPNQPLPFTLRARHRDGTFRTLECVFVNLIGDSPVGGVVVNFRDVSDRKRIEAQLMAADRMVSIGTLAAGVAHEINNPLAYVLANLELLAAGALAPEQAASALHDAHDGAERMRQIVRDLKSFSRADETRLGPVDMHKVVDASASIAWNEIRHRCRLVRDFGEGVPPVLGNEARLGQVMLNLLVNAAQSMGEGNAAANEIKVSTRKSGAAVIVEVRDTGAGIEPELLARLFEPFFTTKAIGVGTGLGLYICQQIVSSMGGKISVTSAPGKGSTFRIELPAALAPQEQPAQLAPAKAAPLRARVLTVDDEPLIGRVLRQALEAHEVTELTSATEALRRIREGERFDLIICDLMMPHMTGMDFHKALAAEAPEQADRMVFLTGGAFTPGANDFLDRSQAPRLDKPFALQAIRDLVAERLAALSAAPTLHQPRRL